MAKKFKTRKKKLKFTKDAVVCLRGVLLSNDDGKKGDRFVAFTRDAEVKVLKDLHKRRGGYKVGK